MRLVHSGGDCEECRQVCRRRVQCDCCLDWGAYGVRYYDPDVIVGWDYRISIWPLELLIALDEGKT